MFQLAGHLTLTDAVSSFLFFIQPCQKTYLWSERSNYWPAKKTTKESDGITKNHMVGKEKSSTTK